MPRTAPYIFTGPYLKPAMVLLVATCSCYAIAVGEQQEISESKAVQAAIEDHRKILHDSEKLQTVFPEDSLAYKALDGLIEKESAAISSIESSVHSTQK